MNWITWEKVGVDRIGCAWLIRRFIDAKAKFQFVPADAKTLPRGAKPFDIPGARLSHHRGHCSFHAFLREYKLKDPVLERIARMIDEVDTVQEVSVEPAAVGLDVICEGIRMASGSDDTAIERGAIVYDALYAYLKETTGATRGSQQPARSNKRGAS
jgi:hypothetical protein